jgi:hypothetical protein
VHGYAQSGPQPPCGNEPVPPYPDPDNSPIVKFWSDAVSSRDWRPPACTGWAEAGFSTLITTVARFRYAAGTEGLLRHIAATSELAGVALLVDHSQAVADINCERARFNRLAARAESPLPGLHT